MITLFLQTLFSAKRACSMAEELDSKELMEAIARKCIVKGKEIIGLDKRSLAVFRVIFALSTFFDIYDRCRDLKAHYTDEGVFPRGM